MNHPNKSPIRIKRESTGWSIRALARHLGITEHAIKSVESGRNRSPSLRLRIEEALIFAKNNPLPRPKFGFASMSKERQIEIASLGGKTAHALGRAHEFTSEEARIAGRKGACRDSEHMKRIGKIGLETQEMNRVRP